jgi:hypothetical protein
MKIRLFCSNGDFVDFEDKAKDITEFVTRIYDLTWLVSPIDGNAINLKQVVRIEEIK